MNTAIDLLDSFYDWKSCSLSSFLTETQFPRNSWKQFFEKNSEELKHISDELQSEQGAVYPCVNDVFKAFIPIEKIRVVILGQDPYHNGSATGYCFQVGSGVKNPSLRNIEKLLNHDADIDSWVSQGCFMLNTALTVKEAKPESHLLLWKKFTEGAIKHLCEESSKQNRTLVFLFFGAKALAYRSIIGNHIYIACSHPSPYSASSKLGSLPSFFESNVFEKCNEELIKLFQKKIVW